jgi:hypothetical protein
MGALLQDGLADGTVGRNITFTLKLSGNWREHNGKQKEYSKQAGSFWGTDEYKKSACQDLTLDLKILYVQ